MEWWGWNVKFDKINMETHLVKGPGAFFNQKYIYIYILYKIKVINLNPSVRTYID